MMEYYEYFQYPINTAKLLAKKKRIKRHLMENLKNPIHKKIAVLGGSTTDELVDQLELFLLKNGISAEFYQSEYNQYWQDAVFGNHQLDAFQPDVIYIHTNWCNISTFPSVGEDNDSVQAKLHETYNHFETAWNSLKQKFSCPIIQNNFERPNYRLLGNRDIWDVSGKSNFIFRLNQMFYEYASQNKEFYINDIDYLAADFGISKWNDPFYYHMYKYAINLNAIPLVAHSIANIIKSIYGKNKKVMALDLDNTLWGGVIGDDGQEGIIIGPEVPEGQAYIEFQQYCKALKNIGVVLTVNSKNDESNAVLGLNHPNSLLKPDDFVSIKANWQSKDVNILETASELNLGSDSFVFVDDNPMERDIVKSQIPDIAVPSVKDAEHYIEVIDHEGYFETTVISDEDLRKTEMYKANKEREKQQLTYADYGEYLESLQMVATIRPFDDISVSRVAQLTNKSNQFNLTTMRCSEDDIRNMKESSDFVTLSGSLSDKFGDNGIVAIVSGEIVELDLHIRLWLMSCRVLKRGMENAMMNELVNLCKDKGIKRLIGYYYPTAKNAMVKDFYKQYGFSFEEISEGTKWTLNIEDYVWQKNHITIRK